MREDFTCRICKQIGREDQLKYQCAKHGEICKNCVTSTSPLGRKRCRECTATVTAFKFSSVTSQWGQLDQ